jgi:hypothetical protein
VIELSRPVQDRLAATGLAMQCTCTAAPEQYELFKDGAPAGYIRVRWSHFTVDFPEAAGECLHDGSADGFGCFTDSEREACLLMAIDLIEKRMAAA